MPRDPTTFMFISAGEMAQRELAAAETHLAAIKAQVPARLLVEDYSTLQAELREAQQRFIRARAAVKDTETTAELKAAAAREREERARLKNLRARSGELGSAVRSLEGALVETERHYSRATDCVGAIAAALPEDVVLPPGHWAWDAAEVVENAAAVEAVVREQIAIAAAALRASGSTEDTNTEDTPEDTNTVPAPCANVYTAADALSESGTGTVTDDDASSSTSTSTSTGEA